MGHREWWRILLRLCPGGRLDGLKLLRQHGFAWGDLLESSRADTEEARELLKWAKENGCPFNHHSYMDAIRAQVYPNLEWLLSNGIPHESNVINYAAELGSLEALELLGEYESPLNWKTTVPCDATRTKNIEALKWLRDKGCPWDEWVFHAAADGTDLELLKWLREQGCPWTAYTFERAAVVGNKEILEWLRENECPSDTNAFAAAASVGKVETMEWLREHQYPWDEHVRVQQGQERLRPWSGCESRGVPAVHPLTNRQPERKN